MRRSFSKLIQPQCDGVAKPAWWSDEALLSLWRPGWHTWPPPGEEPWVGLGSGLGTRATMVSLSAASVGEPALAWPGCSQRRGMWH